MQNSHVHQLTEPKLNPNWTVRFQISRFQFGTVQFGFWQSELKNWTEFSFAMNDTAIRSHFDAMADINW